MSALHHRRAACLAFVVPVAIVGLTACGGPTEPQTYQPRNLADAANATVNELALRAVSILPPPDGESYPAGSDAKLVFTVANLGKTGDVLTAIRSTGTTSVALVDRNLPADSVVVPTAGVTADASAVLRGFTAPLRSGSYLTVTFVFRDNGSQDVQVPVAVGNSPAPRATAQPSTVTVAE